MSEPDDLDGCRVLLDGESRRNPTDDRDVPWIVLFASLFDRDTIARVRELREATDAP